MLAGRVAAIDETVNGPLSIDPAPPSRTGCTRHRTGSTERPRSPRRSSAPDLLTLDRDSAGVEDLLE